MSAPRRSSRWVKSRRRASSIGALISSASCSSVCRSTAVHVRPALGAQDEPAATAVELGDHLVEPFRLVTLDRPMATELQPRILGAEELLRLDAHLLEALVECRSPGDGQVGVGEPAQQIDPLLGLNRRAMRVGIRSLGDLVGGHRLTEEGVGDVEAIEAAEQLAARTAVSRQEVEHRQIGRQRSPAELAGALRRRVRRRIEVLGEAAEVLGVEALGPLATRHRLNVPPRTGPTSGQRDPTIRTVGCERRIGGVPALDRHHQRVSTSFTSHE